MKQPLELKKLFSKWDKRKVTVVAIWSLGLLIICTPIVEAAVRSVQFDDKISKGYSAIADEDFLLALSFAEQAEKTDKGRLEEVESLISKTYTVRGDIPRSIKHFKYARKLELEGKKLSALNHYKLVGEYKFSYDEKAQKRITALKKMLTKQALSEAKSKASWADYTSAKKIVLAAIKNVGYSESLSTAAERYKEKAAKQKIDRALAPLRSKYDSFKSVTWYRDQTSPSYLNRNGFFLEIALGDDGSKAIYLRMRYYADDWLFIRDAEANADGEIISLHADDFDRDNSGGMIWEWNSIEVSDTGDEYLNFNRANLDKIVNSDHTVVRYTGSDYYKDISITDSQKRAMKRVLKAFDAIP